MASDNAWLDDIAAALSEGPLEMSKIPTIVPKPPSVTGKLKALLESQPMRFEIRPVPKIKDQRMVHLKREATAPSFDELLQDMSREAELAHARHLKRDEQVRSRMEQLLRTSFPQASVAPFGSAASGLRVSSADIDLCVTFPDEQGRHWDDCERRTTSVETIKTIAKLLRKSSDHHKVEPIAKARVPIVKAVDKVANLACDVVPHAALAWHNSQLLSRYCELEPLVRRLCLIVKVWASRRAVSSAMHAFLSSYAHVVTVLHYCLAAVSPPLLVDLQAPELLVGLPESWCDGFDVRMCSLEVARSALDAKRRAAVAQPLAHIPQRAANLPPSTSPSSQWPPKQSQQWMIATLRSRRKSLSGEARDLVEAALQIALHMPGALADAALVVALDEISIDLEAISIKELTQELTQEQAKQPTLSKCGRTDSVTETGDVAGAAPRPPSLATLLRGFFEYMVSLTEGREGMLAISLHEKPLSRSREISHEPLSRSREISHEPRRARAPPGSESDAEVPPYTFPKSAWTGGGPYSFSIEDPFETVHSRKPHDLCAPLNKQTALILRGEYRRAATLLAANLTESGDVKPGGMSAADLLEEVLRFGTSPCRRRSDEDGKAYTEQEYVDYYGREEGTHRWASGALVDE
jgi:predicted nucleotidyltransferase